jgi:hypothetical protein
VEAHALDRARGKSKQRSQVGSLDTYAECLDTVMGERDWGGPKP